MEIAQPRLRPRCGGAFALPVLHPKVPVLKKTDVGMHAFAQLALAADGVGVPLAGSLRSTAEQVCRQTWQSWCKDQLKGSRLQADLHIWATEKEIGVKLTPYSRIPLFIVGKQITKLNSEMDGLGWFVLDAIGERKGLMVYDFGLYASHIARMTEECTTNEEYVRKCGHNYGIDIEDDQEVTENDIQKMSKQVNRMPEDFTKLVGGNGHLVHYYPSGEKPIERSIHAVRRNLSKLTPESQAIVRSALDLLKLPDSHFDHYIDDCEFIGALAQIGWDKKTDWVKEIVSDYESDVYNSGQGCECISMQVASTENAGPELFTQFAINIKTLIHRLVAMDRLLKHFPEER